MKPAKRLSKGKNVFSSIISYNDNKVKRILSLMICTVLLFGCIAPAFATTGTHPDMPAPTSAGVYHTNSSQEKLAPVADGDELNEGDLLLVELYWDELPFDDSEAPFDLNRAQGNEYSLGDYSKLFKAPAMDKEMYPVQVLLEEGPVTFATLWHNTDGTLSLEFPDTLNDAFQYGVEELYVRFANKLADQGNTDGTEGEVTFTIPLTTTEIRFVDPDGIPRPPKLEKSVGSNDIATDGTVTWKLTYTAPSEHYAFPEDASGIQITDTLPEQMTYVADSVTADPRISVNTSVDGKIIFDLNALPKDETVYTLTYKTKATDEALLGILGVLPGAPSIDKFTNTAQLRFPDSAAADPFAPVTATADVSKQDLTTAIISKNGTKNSVDSGKIDWTLELDTFGMHFKDITIFDQRGAALEAPTEIHVNDGSNTVTYTVPTAGQVELHDAPDITGTDDRQLQIKVISGGAPLPGLALKSHYTITYTTDIKSDFFDLDKKMTESALQNKAWLEWTWWDGDGGIGIDLLKPPVLTVKPGDILAPVTNTLKKSANTNEYDAINHVLKWTLKVNDVQQDLQSFKLTDTLNCKNYKVPADIGSSNVNTYNQTLYKVGNDPVTDATSLQTALENWLTAKGLTGVTVSNVSLSKTVVDNDTFTATFTGLGKRKLELPVYSQCIDPAFNFGTVSNATFNNSAGTTEMTVSGVTFTSMLTASANQKQSSKMLVKAVTKYDPANHWMDWKLTINEKGTHVHDVVITDTLPKGLTYVSITELKLGGTKISAADMDANVTVASTTDTDGVEKVTFTFATDVLDGKKGELTIRTYVDPNFENLLKNTGWTYKNSAKLSSYELPGDKVSVTANATIQNDTIKKTAPADSTDPVRKFRIDVNPNRLELPVDAEGLKIVDTLPAGAVLDQESVKLYSAKETISLSGSTFTVTLKTDTLIPFDDTDYVFTYDTDTRTFSVSLKDETQAYILLYDVYIMVPGVTLKNDAALKGTTPGAGPSATESTKDFKLVYSASVKLKSPPSNYTLQVNKVDQDGHTIKWSDVADNETKNARFDLYYLDSSDSKVYVDATATVSTSGYATFSFPASVIPGTVTKLILEETRLPEGYCDKTDRTMVIPVSSLEKGKIVSVEVENQKYSETAFTAKKVWANDSSFTDARGDYTLQLYQDGNPYGTPVTLAPGVTSYTWTDLPGYSMADSHKLIYTVAETVVPIGYNASVVGNTITNTYQTEKITATKIWDDPFPDFRGSYTLQLYRNGAAYRSPVTLAKDVLSYTWTDLPKLDSTGTPYVYTVDETGIPADYYKTVSGFVITNHYIMPEVSVSMSKTWDDVNPNWRAPYTVTLYRDGSPVSSITLAPDITAYTWEHLPRYDLGDAHEYAYTLGENGVPAYYLPTVSGYSITNTFVMPEISVTMTKIWKDSDPTRRAGYAVTLSRDGTPIDTVALEPDVTTYTWDHLPKYDVVDKHEYTYTIAETTVPFRYFASVSGYTITNTYRSGGGGGGGGTIPPEVPPVDPIVDPPVDPPVTPPVDPPVTPPVAPPVTPPGGGTDPDYEDLDDMNTPGHGLHGGGEALDDLDDMGIPGYGLSRIPQTGALWWLISALAAVGICLTSVSLYQLKRYHGKHEKV